MPSSKKNPAKEAFGKWKAFPEKLPRTWHKATPYARFMGLELFRCCDDAYQGIVDTTSSATWMDDACRQLQIDGNYRQVAKQSLEQLVGLGLIRIFENHIFVDVGQKGALADSKRTEPSLPFTKPATKPKQARSKSGSSSVQSGSPLGSSQVLGGDDLGSIRDSTQPIETVELTSSRVGKEREGKDRIGEGSQQEVVIYACEPPPQALFPDLVPHDPPDDPRPKRNRQRKAATRDPLVAAVSDIWTRLYRDRWSCPHHVKDSAIAEFVDSCRQSAYWADGTQYDLLSIAKCVLWGYINDESPAVLKRYHPLKWIFDYGRFTRYLHEFPPDIPDEFRPVKISEAAAE